MSHGQNEKKSPSKTEGSKSHTLYPGALQKVPTTRKTTKQGMSGQYFLFVQLGKLGITFCYTDSNRRMFLPLGNERVGLKDFIRPFQL